MPLFPLILFLCVCFVLLALTVLYHAKGRRVVKKNLCALMSQKLYEIMVWFPLWVWRTYSKGVTRYETLGTGSGTSGEDVEKTMYFRMHKLKWCAVFNHRKNVPRARDAEQRVSTTTRLCQDLNHHRLFALISEEKCLCQIQELRYRRLAPCRSRSGVEYRFKIGMCFYWPLDSLVSFCDNVRLTTHFLTCKTPLIQGALHFKLVNHYLIISERDRRR